MPSRRQPAIEPRPKRHTTPRDQVRLPALAMFVAAGVWTSALLVFTVFTGWQLTSAGAPDGERGPISTPSQFIVQTIWSAVMLVVCGVIATGALRMYQLRNRRLAWCAAILSVIPCVAPCYIGALPLGIWAIIVLRRPDVAEAFK